MMFGSISLTSERIKLKKKRERDHKNVHVKYVKDKTEHMIK